MKGFIAKPKAFFVPQITKARFFSSRLTPIIFPEKLKQAFIEQNPVLGRISAPNLAASIKSEEDKEIINYNLQMKRILTPSNISKTAENIIKFLAQANDPVSLQALESIKDFQKDQNKIILAFSGIPSDTLSYAHYFLTCLCQILGFEPFSEESVARIVIDSTLRTNLIPAHTDFLFQNNLRKPDLLSLLCLEHQGLTEKVLTFFIEAKKIYNLLPEKYRIILSSPFCFYHNVETAEYSNRPGGIFYRDAGGSLHIAYDSSLHKAVMTNDNTINHECGYSKEEIRNAMLLFRELITNISKDENQASFYMELKKGDLVLFRNYQGLHGRSEIISDDRNKIRNKRLLIRALHSSQLVTRQSSYSLLP